MDAHYPPGSPEAKINEFIASPSIDNLTDFPSSPDTYWMRAAEARAEDIGRAFHTLLAILFEQRDPNTVERIRFVFSRIGILPREQRITALKGVHTIFSGRLDQIRSWNKEMRLPGFREAADKVLTYAQKARTPLINSLPDEFNTLRDDMVKELTEIAKLMDGRKLTVNGRQVAMFAAGISASTAIHEAAQELNLSLYRKMKEARKSASVEGQVAEPDNGDMMTLVLAGAIYGVITLILVLH